MPVVLTLIPVHLNLKHAKISWCMNGSTSSAQQRRIDTLLCFTLNSESEMANLWSLIDLSPAVNRSGIHH